MKKIISLSFITLSSVLYADMSAQEFLYQDARIMGMGGASVATGGKATSIFSNPAGIIQMKKSDTVQVKLLGTTVSASQNTQSAINDFTNLSSNDTQGILNTTKKYSGKAFGINVSNYTSVSYHAKDDIAYSVGILGALDLNFVPHQNSGANGILETHSRAYAGLFLSGAKKYSGISPKFLDNKLDGDLTVGVSLKYIRQKSYEAGLDIGDITRNQNNLSTYLRDNYEVDNSGVAVDVGLLYELSNAKWNPVVGLSLMNIGSMNFDAYGAQQFTANIGASITPEVSWSKSLKISVDYVDLFNSQQIRVRNYNSSRTQDEYNNANVGYEFMNHLRIGASTQLIEKKWFSARFDAGIYKGSYTAGIDADLTFVKLQFTTYQEQLGSTIGQIPDRRYIVNFGVNF